MKQFLRLLCACLCCCVLIPLAACGKKNDTPPPGSGETPTSDATGEDYDENGYLRDRLPDNLNYGNETFNILYWNNAPTYEFSIDRESELSAIEEAVFNRNSAVEERLRVRLKFEGRDGDLSNQSKILRYLDTTVGNGTQNYDLLAMYTMVSGALMIRGYSRDLMQTEYFSADMPWWPENLISEATVGEKLYFASGDISTNLLWSMYAVLYNRTMLTEYGLNEEYDPDTLALNGNWTLSTMMEMASNVSGDIDGTEGKSEKDRFGFSTLAIYGDSFFFGSGLRTTERNDSGELILSPTFGSEKTQALLVTLTDFFETDSAWLAYDDNDWSRQPYFAEGNVLLDLRPMYYLPQVLNAEGSSYKVDYGILPVPKYDDSQREYVTTVGYTYTLYSIPTDTPNAARSSAVLEALGSEAYRTTTPAVFVTTMQKRYSKDDRTSMIFDRIRGTVSFDIGRLLCASFKTKNYANATYRMFRSALGEGDTNWMSTFEGERKSLESALESIVARIERIQ